MKPFLRILFSLIFVSTSTNIAFAQGNKGEIKGKILESPDKKPLPYATVAVYTAQDTTLITFRVTDEKGAFRAPGLPLNTKIRVVVSMTGFSVLRKELTITSDKTSLDLGELALGQSSKTLNEVLITAEIPPIVVRKDTLEFNANSFKTLPTALVEDLLKKLPGVQVDGSGNISVNGKAVNKILVDGKEFFGNDPKVATRNLPADIVDKVQVVNDPDALRRDPNMPANLIPQVINLKLKKGIKKGLFGKVYAGAGNNNRYESGGILNIFRDTTQISLLGYSNNLNRPGFGFEDISRIGGFNRTNINSMMVNSDGGFALNDISFGGTDDGIQQSSGGGSNFNTILNNGIKLNLQYFFGNINSDVSQITNSQQTLEGFTLDSRRTREQQNYNYSHRLGGRLEWQIDSLTNFNITPSLTLTNSNSGQTSLSSTLQNLSKLLNESNNTQDLANNGTGVSSTMSFDHGFKKKGRNLDFYGNYTIGNGANDQYNLARNIFYEDQPRFSMLDQLRANNRANLNLNNAINYTEPLSKTISAVLQLGSEYFSDQNKIATFNKSSISGNYDNIVPVYSDDVNRTGWRNNLTSSLRWRKKDWNIQPGVRFSTIDITNTFQKIPTVKQKFFYVQPSLNISWKDLYFSYNAYIQEPYASDLQPVTDNTDPLFIIKGNPLLQPTVSNYFNGNYRLYNTKHSLNFNLYLNGRIDKNAIIREQFIDENGVKTSQPVNINGNWNAYSYISISKDYKYNVKNTFSIGGNLNIDYSKSLVLLNDIQSDAVTYRLSPSVQGRMNLEDKFELGQTIELGTERSYYESDLFPDLDYISKSFRTDLVIRLPKKLVWESTIDYRYNSNTAPGIQRDFTRINASVTYLFMKNDRAQLKLSIYDMFNQNISAYRNIIANMITDVQTTVLRRYGLVTLTYNIRNFGGKVGGSNSFFRF